MATPSLPPLAAPFRPILMLAALAAAAAGGCHCGEGDTDAASDAGPMLLSTNTLVAVTSAVPGVDQLHITMVLSTPSMGGECPLMGAQYEGDVPEILAGATLDLSCPNNPNNCPTFFINWAGTDGVATLGGMHVGGVADISCQLNMVIDAYSAGSLVATGTTSDAFVFYGVTSGPRSVTVLQ
ncbi:MAG TPA: hypothetical protein VG389_20280 [Myxococcota bacterium]|jgi:hypothetical protein|nr:hypothetical protein [Myxococcota bacterium]